MNQEYRAFKPNELGEFIEYYNFYKHITPIIEHNNEGVTAYFTISSIRCNEDYCTIKVSDDKTYTLNELYSKYQFVNIQTQKKHPIGYPIEGKFIWSKDLT